MRDARIWARMLGVEHAVAERAEFDETAGMVVVHVRPHARQRGRCGLCGRRCPGYDRGTRRRWRALDLGTYRAVVEADAPRVTCPAHGVVVAAVPWARHGAGHTRTFDEQIAWLAVHMAKSVVAELMRTAWRTVGSILARVSADIERDHDRLAGLRRIGIDEVAYKKGSKYVTVIVDHDTGRLVWAAPGAESAILNEFFEALGPARCAAITHISADGARWITTSVRRYCPQAVRCADPFHVVAWATESLDEVRRAIWNAAAGRRRTYRSGRGATGEARELARCRWALLKNPGNLTTNQQTKLDWIVKTHPRLHRAYQLKEGLRAVFALGGDDGKHALSRWLAWAQRCRIPHFVSLARRIKRHRASIEAALEHGMSNAIVESTNTKIKLITRVAFGFHNVHALIALLLLALGHPRPALPGRT